MMSDTSEDEDMSKFKEAVDDTFTKMINKSRGILKPSQIGDLKFVIFSSLSIIRLICMLKLVSLGF